MYVCIQVCVLTYVLIIHGFSFCEFIYLQKCIHSPNQYSWFCQAPSDRNIESLMLAPSLTVCPLCSLFSAMCLFFFLFLCFFGDCAILKAPRAGLKCGLVS